MKVAFLDRDGTIIVEPPNMRLTEESGAVLFPDTIEALKMLTNAGIAIVIITNQAGIAEGLIDNKDFDRLNNHVIELLKPSGVRVLKTFMCPHVGDDNCDCRKPSPKMILDASKEFGIELENSFMVGDRLSDVRAGINAGTRTILVKTGVEDVESQEASFTAQNLLEAAQYIVEHQSGTI